MTSHVCDAECWALLLRFGQEEFPDCDPFAARAASEAA